MIGAVVVLYNPVADDVDSFLSELECQVDKIILVDNSANQSTQLNLNHEKVDYVFLKRNVGIAAAQNIGLELLSQHGCEYGVIFDQDSKVGSDFVENLVSVFRYSSKIIAVGPKVLCEFENKQVTPKLQKTLYDHQEYICVPQLIASGMTIKLAYIQESGLKEEALFIDGVDHEWCWRARSKGYEVVQSKNVSMVHKLGDSRGRFLGVSYKVGAPIRLYYQFRNILLLSRRAYVPTYWKVRCIVRLPIRFLLNVLFQKNRGLRFKYMCVGFWHGLLGRNGNYSKK